MAAGRQCAGVVARRMRSANRAGARGSDSCAVVLDALGGRDRKNSLAKHQTQGKNKEIDINNMHITCVYDSRWDP